VLLRIFLALPLVILSSLCAKAQTLYERPVLIVDPDMHTDVSTGAAADAGGRLLATGSNDKTVRIWSASDGKLIVSSSAPIGRFAPLTRKARSYGNALRRAPCGRSTSAATAG
jgi:WD40 repeat protein